jgi:hypothetical protein
MVAAAIQSTSHLKKSSSAGTARGRSTQRQSNRDRGRADSVAGRSSSRRGRGRSKGSAVNAAVGDDVMKQFVTSEMLLTIIMIPLLGFPLYLLDWVTKNHGYQFRMWNPVVLHFKM